MALTPIQRQRLMRRNRAMLMAYAAAFNGGRAVAAEEAAWTPEELFAASEQGVWYDPSDFSTMFQDSAGTTPVTAVEQTVGLILDKSKGAGYADGSFMGLGAEILSNPNFDANVTGWTNNPNSTITWDADDGGSALVNVTGSGGGIADSQTVTTVVGRTYVFEARIKLGTFVGDLNFNPDTGIARVISPTADYQTFRTVFVATDVDANISITRATTNTGTFYVSSISLKELPGNHASQATLANRPVLRATDRLDFDGSDDKLTAAASGAGTTGFLFVAGINLDTIGANQTIWSDTGTNTGYRVRINSSNQLELAAGNGSAYTTVTTTATLSATTNYVIAAWHDGTNLNAKLGTGGDVASTAFVTASAGSAGFTVGMDNGAVSSQLNGKIYNAIYVKNFAGTLADVNNAITYVNGTLA